MSHRLIKHVILFLLFPCIISCSEEATVDNNKIFSEMMTLLNERDFFKLSAKLSLLEVSESPEIQFFTAAAENAFNNLQSSNEIISDLLSESSLPDSLNYKLYALKMNNHLRLYQYREAFDTASIIMDAPAGEIDPVVVSDIENTSKILKAISDIPPQNVNIKNSSTIVIENGRIPVDFDGEMRNYIFDTGANFSLVIQSEAVELGLDIRKAGVEVGTSTDIKIYADIAVAGKLTIGNIDYDNVVFLVVPDEMLTFPGGYKIPGIIGFPVIEAMKEIRFRKDGTLEIPESPSQQDISNIALDELDILTLVEYGADSLICRLDSGANATALYEPFLEKYYASVTADQVIDTLVTGGVGGNIKMPVYNMENVKVKIGNKEIVIPNTSVYTRPVTSEENNYLYGNIGIDVLHNFDEYIINFLTMTLLIR
ncbi:retropepsin-like aspartic protease [candidate division KSB1 bacterium]